MRERGLIQGRSAKGKGRRAQSSQPTSQARPRRPQNIGEVASATTAAMPPMAPQANWRRKAAARAKSRPSGARNRVALKRAAMPKTAASPPRTGGSQRAVSGGRATGSASSAGGVARAGQAAWALQAHGAAPTGIRRPGCSWANSRRELGQAPSVTRHCPHLPSPASGRGGRGRGGCLRRRGSAPRSCSRRPSGS
jgi:hypothetical protein